MRRLALTLSTDTVIKYLQTYTQNRTDTQEVDERAAHHVQQQQDLRSQAGDPANTQYSHRTGIAPPWKPQPGWKRAPLGTGWYQHYRTHFIRDWYAAISPPPSILYGILIVPQFIGVNSNTPACGFLIGRVFSLGELPFLIDTIFSSEDWGDVVHRIHSGDDAQTFIDVIDEVRPESTHR